MNDHRPSLNPQAAGVAVREIQDQRAIAGFHNHLVTGVDGGVSDGLAITNVHDHVVARRSRREGQCPSLKARKLVAVDRRRDHNVVNRPPVVVAAFLAPANLHGGRTGGDRCHQRLVTVHAGISQIAGGRITIQRQQVGPGCAAIECDLNQTRLVARRHSTTAAFWTEAGIKLDGHLTASHRREIDLRCDHQAVEWRGIGNIIKLVGVGHRHRAAGEREGVTPLARPGVPSVFVNKGPAAILRHAAIGHRGVVDRPVSRWCRCPVGAVTTGFRDRGSQGEELEVLQKKRHVRPRGCRRAQEGTAVDQQLVGRIGCQITRGVDRDRLVIHRHRGGTDADAFNGGTSCGINNVHIAVADFHGRVEGQGNVAVHCKGC